MLCGESLKDFNILFNVFKGFVSFQLIWCYFWMWIWEYYTLICGTNYNKIYPRHNIFSRIHVRYNIYFFPLNFDVIFPNFFNELECLWLFISNLVTSTLIFFLSIILVIENKSRQFGSWCPFRTQCHCNYNLSLLNVDVWLVFESNLISNL